MQYISRDAALSFDSEVECAPEDIQLIMQGMALYAEHIKSLPVVEISEGKEGKNG